jgi:hypothetical protein
MSEHIGPQVLLARPCTMHGHKYRPCTPTAAQQLLHDSCTCLQQATTTQVTASTEGPANKARTASIMPRAMAVMRRAWSSTPSCPDTIMYASPAGTTVRQHGSERAWQRKSMVVVRKRAVTQWHRSHRALYMLLLKLKCFWSQFNLVTAHIAMCRTICTENGAHPAHVACTHLWSPPCTRQTCRTSGQTR